MRFIISLRGLLSLGRKPKNENVPPGSPDSTTAVSTADAPGITVYGSPCSMHADTRTAPGSEMPGIPASER